MMPFQLSGRIQEPKSDSKQEKYIKWNTKRRLGRSEEEVKGLGMCVSYTSHPFYAVCKPCSPKAKLEIRTPWFLF